MKIKLIDFGAAANGRLPARQHFRDIGADCFAQHGGVIAPNSSYSMPLGFGIELPDGYAGFIFPRTGLSKEGIVCELPPIDPGYTGEVHAIISNLNSEKAFHVEAGMRIGQLVILPAIIPEFVTEFPDEEKRGAGAFGSTGQ